MIEMQPLETLTAFTIRRIRAEIMEECAKIADQIAINAERRAAGHIAQSQAQEAAYNKMEGAQQVALQIRERLSALSPTVLDTEARRTQLVSSQDKP